LEFIKPIFSTAILESVKDKGFLELLKDYPGCTSKNIHTIKMKENLKILFLFIEKIILKVDLQKIKFIYSSFVYPASKSLM